MFFRTIFFRYALRLNYTIGQCTAYILTVHFLNYILYQVRYELPPFGGCTAEEEVGLDIVNNRRYLSFFLLVTVAFSIVFSISSHFQSQFLAIECSGLMFTKMESYVTMNTYYLVCIIATHQKEKCSKEDGGRSR